MERSYARSTRYGFDRARWRGLWKVAIQEYFICAIQNIEILIRHTKKTVRGVLCLTPLTALWQAVGRSFGLFKGQMISLLRKEGADTASILP
jgi:hypothetical protein